ncbi:MAG: patatin-like phospholipase family protein, partial [Loktanella sp.]|nr:patatin-like phospholipase family protein [Loktanella sp.]
MKRINLALQGGGAHGAFTWGVLDVLLADEEIEIAAISGTSAGALNAAAL